MLRDGRRCNAAPQARGSDSRASPSGRPTTGLRSPSRSRRSTNSNTLDVLREQSNVGERVFFTSIWEGADRPRLARPAWSRARASRPSGAGIDDKTVELQLRQGVKFHNGDEMTAEDVVFSFCARAHVRQHRGQEPRHHPGVRAHSDAAANKELPPEVPAIARRMWPDLLRVEAVDQLHGALPQRDARRHARRPPLALRLATSSAAAPGTDAASYLDWARKPITTGPYRVVEFKPDVSLTPRGA